MDLIDIGLLLLLAWVFMRLLFKTPSANEQEITRQVEQALMVTIDHHVDSRGADVYLVHKADNNEFITQCSKLDDIMPALFTQFKDRHIFLATENLSLVGLFLQKEKE